MAEHDVTDCTLLKVYAWYDNEIDMLPHGRPPTS